MKHFFYILFFLTIGLNALAQRQMVKNLTTFDDKRLHFGFTLAYSTLDFNIDHYQTMSENPKFDQLKFETIDGIIDGNRQIRADISTLTPGFTVGIVTNLRMTEYLDLRFLPGMSFGERKLVYNIHSIYSDSFNNLVISDDYPIKSTFLDFPLLLKYKAKRMNNQRPYLVGGVAYRIDISKTDPEDLVRLKPISSSVEVGVGWDTYLQFFRLSTELKFSFGLSDVLDNGPEIGTQPQVYTNAFSKLTSNMFIFSFHFE